MEKQTAIAHFGSVIKLGHALRVSPQAIYNWKGGVPLKHQLVLEQMTGGVLKATLPTPPADEPVPTVNEA